MAYTVLKGEMAKANITIEAIAELLNIHRNSVSYKLNKSGSFSIEETIAIRNAFFSGWNLDDLFAKDEEVK